MKSRRGTAARHALAASLAALVLALVAAGCGSTTTPTAVVSPGPPTDTAAPGTGAPTPTDIPGGSPDLAAVYSAIEDQVIALRGLPAKQRLEPRILTEAQLREEMKKQSATQMPPAEMADANALLTAFGLIDPGASLADLYLDMIGSQVAGFYDTKAKTISVVARSGSIGPIEKVTFAHEFDHALQDQSFDLQGVTADTVGQGDKSLAQLAVVEGDATLLMSLWMQKLDPADMAELLKGDPAAQAQLEKIPPFLRESLLFPYSQGLGFVMGTWTNGGWEAVNALYADLPISTEQVIHPEKYAAHEPPIPVEIDAAAATKALGAGWTAAPLDTFGEFQIRAWLAARIGDGAVTPEIRTAGTGWGGDRLLVLRGPSGAYAVALVTAWDTSGDAAEFQAAAVKAVAELPAAQVVQVGGGAPGGGAGGGSSGGGGPGGTEPARWAVLAASSADVLTTLRSAVAPPAP